MSPISGTIRTLAIGLASLTGALVGIAPAQANDDYTATTVLTDVRGGRFPGDRSAFISFTAHHEILETMPACTGFPSGKAPLPETANGFWGGPPDGLTLHTWLSRDDQDLFELPWVETWPEVGYWSWIACSDDQDDLQAGDVAEMASLAAPLDAPAPWTRQRGQATGTLGWDVATDSRTLSGSFGGVTGSMDQVSVRADLVARLGDVDARRAPVAAPPLVIDLPRVYGPGAVSSGIFVIDSAAGSYIQGSWQSLPEAGKAVMTATLGDSVEEDLELDVGSYLPEAREYDLPGGTQMHEWHIPIYGTIAIANPLSPLGPRLAAVLPEGGQGWILQDGRVSPFRATPGTSLMVGSGVDPQVLTGELVTVKRHERGEQPSETTPSEMDDYLTTASIGPWTTEPTRVSVGYGNYSATVDPNYRGEGILALTDVRRGRDGGVLASTLAVPYVILDGTPIRLDRSRLQALRVMPSVPAYSWFVYCFQLTRAASYPPWQQNNSFGGCSPGTVPGIRLEAQYDLGAGRHGWLLMYVRACDSWDWFSGDCPARGVPVFAESGFWTVTDDGEYLESSPTGYVEVPQGQVTHRDEIRTTEFSADGGPLVVGDHTVATGKSVTVRRAPAPLTAVPTPDPTASLEGGPLAIYTEGRAGAVTLNTLPPPRVANPPPLGTPCGTPQVQDVEVSDALPDLDIESAWMDSDEANLYATLKIRNLPEAAPEGEVYRYELWWNHEHGTWVSPFATLDASGKWEIRLRYSFHAGPVVGGEVRTGPEGLIRWVVPRSQLGEDPYIQHNVHDGHMLRDFLARSHVVRSGTSVRVDSAPNPAPESGFGGDYVIGSCI